MKYLLYILILFSATPSSAQQADPATEFIRWFFATKKNVVYSDEIPFFMTKIADPVRSDIISGGGSSGTEVLTLTKDEQSAFQRSFIEVPAETWKVDLIPNSKLVASNTIAAVLNDKSKSWTYFHTSYGPGFYSFSRPLFFKGNTFCVFYHDYSCGNLCGGGEWAVYKKTNGSWDKWKTLSKWGN